MFTHIISYYYLSYYYYLFTETYFHYQSIFSSLCLDTSYQCARIITQAGVSYVDQHKLTDTQAKTSARAASGQSKNFPVYCAHFSSVWKTIVDKGVKNCNCSVSFIVLENEEPRPDQYFKQDPDAKVTKSLLFYFVFRVKIQYKTKSG